MRKASLAICTILLTLQTFSQEKGIHFIDSLSWSQVKAKAKKERKYIFVDIYATWCGPCKAMDVQVYPDSTIGSLINKNFISVKVQQDQSEKDNEFIRSWYNYAQAITREYKIEAMPSFLFFTSDVKLMHRALGFKNTKEFTSMVDLALTNPMRRLNQQLAAYYNGKRDSAFLRSLTFLASNEEDQLNASIIASEYIKRLKEPFTNDNLEFILRFTQKSTDAGFNILLNNIMKVNKIIGVNRSEQKIREIIDKEELTPYTQNKNIEPEWDKILLIVKNKYGNLGEEKVYGAQMIYYFDKKDWGKFGKYYALYYQTAFTRSEYHINNISWLVFEHIPNREILESALKVVKYNLDNYDTNNPNCIDTYANLLYRLGHISEAINWEKKAVSISEYSNDFVETLHKMQMGIPTWN